MRSWPTILAILLSACAAPRGEQQVTRAMLAVCRAQEAAWNAGDVDGFMAAGYWNSPELAFLSGGSWSRGYQPVLERYRQRYRGEGKEMGVLSFSDLDAVALSPDAGLVRGKWTLVFSTGEKTWGLFTVVMRRLPEGWRIISDHTSLADPN